MTSDAEKLLRERAHLLRSELGSWVPLKYANELIAAYRAVVRWHALEGAHVRGCSCYETETQGQITDSACQAMRDEARRAALGEE